MVFFLPAFRPLKKACTAIPYLCAIHLILTLFYIVYSDNGLSIFRSSKSLSLQNTSLTKNQSEQMLSSMYRKMIMKNGTTELPKCPETSPLLGKLYMNDTLVNTSPYDTDLVASSTALAMISSTV